MSIQTKVEPYCEKCEKFEPETTTTYSANGPEFTIVTCKNAKECAAMYEDLKKRACLEAECTCKKEHVTPSMRLKLGQLECMKTAINMMVTNIVPSARGCGIEYGLNRIQSVFDEKEDQIKKLKCAVAILGGLIAGNVLAWIIGLIF